MLTISKAVIILLSVSRNLASIVSTKLQSILRAIVGHGCLAATAAKLFLTSHPGLGAVSSSLFRGDVSASRISALRLVDGTCRDFLKIARPLTKLLEKDTPFEFNDECQKAFKLLKEKLTCAPVIISPNWNLLLKLMCDANDFAVGAVLGQKDEFDIEIKDRKGTKNTAVDHLSRIENDELSDDSEVDDNFPGETLMEINTKYEPWFTGFTNYLVGDIIPKGMTYQQKNKFFSDLKHYLWEEPYLFKVCSD
nr:hypothetical protein [Tanacetum cinerariifolium]